MVLGVVTSNVVIIEVLTDLTFILRTFTQIMAILRDFVDKALIVCWNYKLHIKYLRYDTQVAIKDVFPLPREERGK